MKVYIEWLFLDNFLMNYLLLYLSAVLLRMRRRHARIAAGAAVGGAYACCLFVFAGAFEWLAIKIPMSFLLCLIAFYRKKQWKTLCRSVLVFYLCTFATGGAVYVFLNAAQRDYALRGGVIVGAPVLRYVVLGTFTAAAILALVRRAYAVYLKKDLTYVLRILFMGNELQCVAYLDTGNALREPISGLPAVIVQKDAVQKLLPPGMADMMAGGPDDGAAANEDWYGRIRILPCKGVYGASGVLYGFKPDGIRLQDNGAEKDIAAVVAVVPEPLSAEGKYQALLGPWALPL